MMQQKIDRWTSFSVKEGSGHSVQSRAKQDPHLALHLLAVRTGAATPALVCCCRGKPAPQRFEFRDLHAGRHAQAEAEPGPVPGLERHLSQRSLQRRRSFEALSTQFTSSTIDGVETLLSTAVAACWVLTKGLLGCLRTSLLIPCQRGFDRITDYRSISDQRAQRLCTGAATGGLFSPCHTVLNRLVH